MLGQIKMYVKHSMPQRIFQIQEKINNKTWAWATGDSFRRPAKRPCVGRVGQGRPQAGPHFPQKGQLSNFPGLWWQGVSLSQPNQNEKGKDAPYWENGHVYNRCILRNTYSSRKCQQARNPIRELGILSCPWRKFFPRWDWSEALPWSHRLLGI